MVERLSKIFCVRTLIILPTYRKTLEAKVPVSSRLLLIKLWKNLSVDVKMESGIIEDIFSNELLESDVTVLRELSSVLPAIPEERGKLIEFIMNSDFDVIAAIEVRVFFSEIYPTVDFFIPYASVTIYFIADILEGQRKTFENRLPHSRDLFRGCVEL